jgi:hypothetical protein
MSSRKDERRGLRGFFLWESAYYVHTLKTLFHLLSLRQMSYLAMIRTNIRVFP